jgi:hypothetical protein
MLTLKQFCYGIDAQKTDFIDEAYESGNVKCKDQLTESEQDYINQ